MDLELEQRGVGPVDQDGDGLFEVDAGQPGQEDPIHARGPLDQPADLTEEGAGGIDDRLNDGIEHVLERSGRREPIGNGENISRLRQVRVLVRLRIARPPQVHAHIDAIGFGHVGDHLAERLHPHRARDEHRGVFEDVRALDVDRGLERLEDVLVVVEQVRNPRAQVRVERQRVVDELPDPRLNPENLCRTHVFDTGHDGAHVDGVRKRLSLNGKCRIRPDENVVEHVVDSDAGGRQCPLAALELVVGVVDIPSPAHRADLDRQTDELLAAVLQSRDVRIWRGRPFGAVAVAAVEHQRGRRR